MPSKTFGTQRAKKSHLVHQAKGGIAGEVGDLRQDVEDAISELEDRTSFPKINSLGSDLPKYGGDLVIAGADLVQGQSFAALTLWLATSQVVITALKPGTDGNDLTVQIADTASAGAETVVKTGNAFVIGIEAAVSTGEQIATAINLAGADSDGYLRAAGGAAAVNAIAAATALTGGLGAGFTCLVNGQEALPANTAGVAGAAALAEAVCTVTVPDISTVASGTPTLVEISSDGVRSNQFSATVVPSVGAPPEVDWLDGTGVAATGADIILEGRNLLQNQTFDELTLWLTTSEVVITALSPGDTGYTIEITDGATAGAEVVSESGGAWGIQIQVGVSDADDIATAINLGAAASDGYLRATSGGAGVTNAIAAAAPMVGGVGEGFVARCGGTVCLPANTTGTTGAAAIDDGTATVAVPDLTGDSPAKAATDIVDVTIESDGIVSKSSLTLTLA